MSPCLQIYHVAPSITTNFENHVGVVLEIVNIVSIEGFLQE